MLIVVHSALDYYYTSCTQRHITERGVTQNVNTITVPLSDRPKSVNHDFEFHGNLRLSKGQLL
jgi:hypothetical protein